MSEQENVLSVCDLTIGYHKKVIANQINLDLKKGEMVCLLGQNGVGKSTLLRTLSLLQPALSGEVYLGNNLISTIDRRLMATKLGIITTAKIGVSSMTVRELVALGRYPYTNWVGKESDEDIAKIESAIDQCRINYIRDAKLSAISDGQFQKAMIARVLAQDTDIVLMDEPTAHLDVVNRVEIFRLLKQIMKSTDKTILISTHELDLSMQFADRLWLMDFNEDMVVGTPEDLGMSGQINKIFHHNDFDLDARTGQIKLNDPVTNSYHLIGDLVAIDWVSKALKRNAYGRSDQGEVISIKIENGQLVWKIGEDKGKGIAGLLTTLNELNHGEN